MAAVLSAGDSLAGPYALAPGPFLDGDARGRHYAGKILTTEDGPRYFRFPLTGPDATFCRLRQ